MQRRPGLAWPAPGWCGRALATALLAGGCARGEAAARAGPAPNDSTRPAAPAGATTAAESAPAAAIASTASAPTASAPAASHPARERTPCPAEMAQIDRFCIDRYEGHLLAERDGALVSHPHFERPAPGVRYIARSETGTFPQAYISRVEAKAACEAAGKRLCSRTEWQRACRGEALNRYPYGPRGKRGLCNTSKPHLLRELFGDHPRGGWRYDEHFNNPELDQRPGFLARTGEHAACVSDEGVFDLIGNLHEWVSDTVDQHLVARLDDEAVERRHQPWRQGNGVFMGGFFSTTSELGPGCYFTTIAHEPTYHDYSTGFRCCAPAYAALEHAAR